ncbi:16S rRNA (cytosine(1402)-N(4))-methyltransferase RsmH [Rubrobacter aplysinae]|uniref:16S rRNA (cytosine(1402)-N(4))-methyltransferase RsmH n=1 Tax=Rubrobacter aplysinae TaxID=909625 RepID=UPI00064BC9CB|nr:16S rRNA (cytosine(1402)-N(4))-methyltransferase RsmH [Rubrobacter aplysinae]
MAEPPIRHVPVMVEEALSALGPLDAPGGTFVDATFGGGGHSARILDAVASDASLIGVDRDPEARERASALAFRDPRLSFRPGAYDEALEALVGEGMRADGILFDLGLSSYQVDEAERGFSYVQDGPLDMRMDPDSGEPASEFLNRADGEEISRVLVGHGDVSRQEARRIVREIERRRPLTTTLELSEAVRAALGWVERGGNPAKRVFQAVRVHVNDEVGSLVRALEAAERLLKPGGRLVTITFHSGEDRVVKRFISDREGRCVCPPELPVCVCGARATLHKGVVQSPRPGEIESNPRSVSARLRSATRTIEPPGDGA